MEVIEVSGYTPAEKIEIARQHLVPKLIREHGLKPEWLELPESTLQAVISHYTREAGVRELERQIAALLRAAAEEVLESRRSGPAVQPLRPEQKVSLTPERLRSLLGPPRYVPEPRERLVRPGIATGLAWTPHGGELLHVEATAMPHGKGQLILTGQLGDVMKESAQIAVSLARSASPELLRHRFDFSASDLHIHVPSGAIPKDGPSAGVTILAALASLLSEIPVRSGVAMTGEITLRGAVLPVGGIKEKVLAAHRAGIRTLILPARNSEDLHDVPEAVRNSMNFVRAETVEQVLSCALGPRYRAQPTATAAAA
jgi:ATP-dependent Lon protease